MNEQQQQQVQQSLTRSERLLEKWTELNCKCLALQQEDPLSADQMLQDVAQIKLQLAREEKFRESLLNLHTRQCSALTGEQKLQLKAVREIYHQLQEQNNKEAQADLIKYV